MSYISLHFGLVRKEKKNQITKKLWSESIYQEIAYIRNDDPSFQNSVLDIVNERSDLKKTCACYEQLLEKYLGKY